MRERQESRTGGLAGVIALYVFTLVALVGYATFGRHPQLLAAFPAAASIYPHTFRIFSIGHVLLAGAVLFARLVPVAGWRWVPAFLALYAISLTAELAGTSVGLPFGEYAYSPLLGTAWFGKVPLVIPLSWFCMAVPSYAFAVLAFDASGKAVQLKRIGAASLILLAWDLSLDPAMSYATRYWIWGSEGPYYGMPWLNLFGWYVTGLLLMAALAGLKAERWILAIDARWWVLYYGANLLLPFGMNAAAGLWGAVAATWMVLMLLAIWLVRPARLSRSGHPAASDGGAGRSVGVLSNYGGD
jgi:uncharacterized membrane protein